MNFILELSKYKTKEGLCQVKIKYKHKGEKYRIGTTINIAPSQFSNAKIVKHHRSALFNKSLASDIYKLEELYHSLGIAVKSLTVKELHRYFLKGLSQKDSVVDFFEYVSKDIQKIKEEVSLHPNSNQSLSTYSNGKTLISKLKEFTGLPVLPINEINAAFASQFELWMKRKGYKPSYIKTNFTVINKYLNMAENEGIAVNHAKKHTIKRIPTEKRNVKIDKLACLLHSNGLCPNEEFARDMFLLQMFMQGIEPKDLFYMKKSDMEGDVITHQRFKTDQLIKIYLTESAKNLIDKYTSDNEFLIDTTYKNYIYFRNFVNKHLTEIAKRIGIKSLTNKMAKHTYITLASKAGVRIDLIQILAGHKRGTVTDVYLEYDDEALMDAAKQIERYILAEAEKFKNSEDVIRVSTPVGKKIRKTKVSKQDIAG